MPESAAQPRAASHRCKIFTWNLLGEVYGIGAPERRIASGEKGMGASPVKRKLAAILAADAVGYGRPMAVDALIVSRAP
jgi:hypothetical protein